MENLRAIAEVATTNATNARNYVVRYVQSLDVDPKKQNQSEPAVWAPTHSLRWGQELACVKLDGKGSALALSPDDQLLAVGVAKEIHVYSVAGHERVEVIRGNLQEVTQLAFGPNLTAGEGYLLVSSAAQVILWELDRKGRVVNEGKDKDVNIAELAKKAAEDVIAQLVREHEWRADEEASLQIKADFHAALNKASQTHILESHIKLEGQLAWFGSPSFSQDGKKMLYITQNDSSRSSSRDSDSVPCVNVWDVETKQTQHRLLGNTDSIMWAAVSPDSKNIASLSWDGTARIWDAESGTRLRVLGPFGGQLWSGAFSPDSKYLAISQGPHRPRVHVYNIESAEEISRFEGLDHLARSIDWSPDGKLIANTGRQGELCVWDPNTGAERMRWSLKSAGDEVERSATVYGVKFIDEGKKLMFRTSEGTTEVYDFTAHLKQLFAMRPEDKVDVSTHLMPVCSSDASFFAVVDADQAVRFWSLK